MKKLKKISLTKDEFKNNEILDKVQLAKLLGSGQGYAYDKIPPPVYSDTTYMRRGY